MIIDGRGIAADIYRELKNQISHLDVAPHLTVFTCAPNFETQKYLALKKRKAQEVGISVNVIEFPASVSTEELKLSLRHSFMQTDGVVAQLPFPEHINTKEVLDIIPPSLDIDALHYDGTNDHVLPPVVGAIAEITTRHNIVFATQKVVVIGEGRLVGKPAAIWAMKQGAQVEVVTRETNNLEEHLKEADIVISGAGQPRLITPEFLKEGVIIFDAGTSEDGGALVGDADPACSETASFFTPVPGGIGPITVAVLLRNLITLVTKRS